MSSFQTPNRLSAVLHVPEGKEIIPFGNKILVRLEKIEEKSSGGLFIPESSVCAEQMGHVMGEIVGMGDMAFRDLFDIDKGFIPDIQIGDWITFDRYAGYAFENGNKEMFRIMNDKDVLAIIKDKKILAEVAM